MGTKTIASIAGARLQFIKAAPVSRALASELKKCLFTQASTYTKVVALTLQLLDKQGKEESMVVVDEDPDDYDIEA